MMDGKESLQKVERREKILFLLCLLILLFFSWIMPMTANANERISSRKENIILKHTEIVLNDRDAQGEESSGDGEDDTGTDGEDDEKKEDSGNAFLDAMLDSVFGMAEEEDFPPMKCWMRPSALWTKHLIP